MPSNRAGSPESPQWLGLPGAAALDLSFVATVNPHGRSTRAHIMMSTCPGSLEAAPRGAPLNCPKALCRCRFCQAGSFFQLHALELGHERHWSAQSWRLAWNVSAMSEGLCSYLGCCWSSTPCGFSHVPAYDAASNYSLALGTPLNNATCCQLQPQQAAHQDSSFRHRQISYPNAEDLPPLPPTRMFT